MEIDNNQKTVFISGSNRGIGRACAELFAQRGWNILAHARQPTPQFELFVTELSSINGVTVTPIYFDMRDEIAMKDAVKTVIYKPKLTVDALINNAGIMSIKLFMLQPVPAIKDVFEINLFGTMRLTQLILKRIPKGGSVTNIASISGISNFEPANAAYTASKAALIAWTKVLSAELIGRVRVNAVAPASTDTDMVRNIAVSRMEITSLILPEAVAKAVYFLSSDEAESVNGDILKVTGGINR
jgi:3-oxoacyl-[acyl-carrier protein] reductase